MGRFQSFLETLTELIVPEITGLELLERIGNFDPVIEVIRLDRRTITVDPFGRP